MSHYRELVAGTEFGCCEISTRTLAWCIDEDRRSTDIGVDIKLSINSHVYTTWFLSATMISSSDLVIIINKVMPITFDRKQQEAGFKQQEYLSVECGKDLARVAKQIGRRSGFADNIGRSC